MYIRHTYMYDVRMLFCMIYYYVYACVSDVPTVCKPHTVCTISSNKMEFCVRVCVSINFVNLNKFTKIRIQLL